MKRGLRTLTLVVAVLAAVGPARAARYVGEPVSDGDDGLLVDGSSWDSKPAQFTLDDILLNLGQEGSSTYDNALAFGLSNLSEGQTVSSVFLRVNQQGGVITSGLTVEISAALDLDPLATAAAARFSLPRTTNTVFWNINAPWDSSAQRIAKYAETPDLSSVVNEVIAQSGWDTSPKEIVLFLEVFSAIGDNVVRYDDTHTQFTGPGGGNAGIEPARLIVNETFRDGFFGKELLCRPKPSSVEVNFIPHANAQAFVEWGTDGVSFPNSTGSATVTAGNAHHFTITGLAADTQYYYRMNVRPIAGTYDTGPTRSFLTLPASGEGRICVTSDIHVTNQLALDLSTQMSLLEDALDYMPGHLAQPYHFWMDLGDLVVIRAQRICFDQEEVEQRYRTAREYVDRIAHSLPFVLVRGNHEEVNGWDYDSTPNNTAIWSGKSLLKYFPPPLPDEFYEGNDVAYPDLGLPGNYFAFDVGALRIRALDPFLFSDTRPHNGHGETGGSLNGWDWSLGQQQYDWLHDDLSAHPSTFSLLAIHHLTSCYAQPGLYYGRGGVEVAKYSVAGLPSHEWGGEDSTGTNVFATQRPGWNHGPPHDLLSSLGNQVLIKGHDHFHARQALDQMVYVTMAKPDATEEQTGNLWGWKFSTYYVEPGTLFLENSGFYSIVVDDSLATYSYVQTYPQAGMGTVRDMFTVISAPTGADVDLNPVTTKTWIQTVRPNPARVPNVQWQLARAGHVRLSVYDTAGRLVQNLIDGRREAGVHETAWDGRHRDGGRVASGVYFVKLEADGRLDAVKLVLIR